VPVNSYRSDKVSVKGIRFSEASMAQELKITVKYLSNR